MSIKLLLTGAGGQIGREIVELATKLKFDLYPYTHQQLNIACPDTVKRIITQVKPDYLLNAAAFTAVDSAEAEKEVAFSVNANGVRYLAEIASQFDIPLLHISTDYVFDGKKKTSYVEEDIPNPLSVYGQSKLAGETTIRQIWAKHIILRVSWVFGRYGNNFVKTILHKAKAMSELRVVCDQRGGPTYAADIAKVLLTIIGALHQGSQAWGTYHYSGLPMISWYQFADNIIEQAKQSQALITKTIFPIPASAYPLPANRPYNSCLLSNKIEQVFDIRPKLWLDGLTEVIKDLS